MDILKDKLQNMSGNNILDVGTGSGSFIEVLKDSLKDYTSITGIDSNERALKAAGENFKEDNISFVKMDAENLTFDDNSFDMVCLSNTLHHLPDIEKVLKEMKRVLKPNGYFIISEMYSDNLGEKQLTHAKLHHFGGEIDMACGICHNETFKREKIVDIVKSIGIDVFDLLDYNTEEEQNEDPNSNSAFEKECIDAWINAYTRRIQQINDDKLKEYFLAKLDTLKNSVYEIGYQGATMLFVIGKK